MVSSETPEQVSGLGRANIARGEERYSTEMKPKEHISAFMAFVSQDVVML